jgi:hypothetical protein
MGARSTAAPADFFCAFCLAVSASYGVIAAGIRRRGAVCIAITTLLFLTSRILETEPYRSDRFEVGFGLATRNHLAVGRTWIP